MHQYMERCQSEGAASQNGPEQLGVQCLAHGHHGSAHQEMLLCVVLEGMDKQCILLFNLEDLFFLFIPLVKQHLDDIILENLQNLNQHHKGCNDLLI